MNFKVVSVDFSLLEYSVMYLSPAIQNDIALCIVTFISDVISKAVKEAGMFVLTFSRRQSNGRSLLFLFISSLLRVQTTVRPFILVYRLSGGRVLIAYCDLQRALSVKYDHVTRNWRRLVQNFEGKPKYWGKVVIIDESLGVSQLWGDTRPVCPQLSHHI